MISAVQGYHLDPAAWTYANHRIPVRYLADVWEIVHHHFAALREFLALLPEDALIIFGAGSPCQDNTKIGRGCGKLGITGTRSVHYHVVYIVMYALQEMGLAHRVVPMLENAGSMANCFKQYIQDTCGASSCIHRINTAEWSAVSRNRYFFVSNSSYIVPSRQTDPWQQGWMLPKPRHKPVAPPLPPWLRTRGITPGGHIRFTTSAYHPRHLLYKIDYFGTVADFHEKCGEQGWPDLPWADFLPATAVRALQQIIQRGAPIAQLPNKEQEAAAAILAEYFDNPSLNFPFRLPSLEEKVVDAELTSFGEDAMHDINIPDRLMHDLIGNYFKPSAVVTALGGKHYLRKLKCGEVEPQTWKPCTPSVLLVEYATIRQQVLKDLDKTLQGFCCQNPFPLGSNFEDENYWHALWAMPYQRPKLTNAAPAPPALFTEPATAPSEPRSILDYLSREQPIMSVIRRSPAVEYTLRSLSSGEEPLFPKLELLGLLDMLGTCDPDMPNLAGMLLWLREQTAPAARSCVLFIGDCGDRVAVHTVGCQPPGCWTAIITFSPGRLIRVYWSHFATTPRGGFLKVLNDNCFSPIARLQVPPLIQSATAEIEKGIILRTTLVDDHSLPVFSEFGYVHKGAITWQCIDHPTPYEGLIAIGRAVGGPAHPPSKHNYQPRPRSDLPCQIAALIAHACADTVVLTALPTDTGWAPTTWYTFHPEVSVPATHDRTSVIFLLVRDRECFALVRKLVPSIAFLGHDLGAVPRVLLSHNDWG